MQGVSRKEGEGVLRHHVEVRAKKRSKKGHWRRWWEGQTTSEEGNEGLRAGCFERGSAGLKEAERGSARERKPLGAGRVAIEGHWCDERLAEIGGQGTWQEAGRSILIQKHSLFTSCVTIKKEEETFWTY